MRIFLFFVVEAGETGSYYGYFNFVLNIGIDARAEDYVCGSVYNAADKFGGVGNLVESEIGTADDVEDYAARPLDCSYEQRAVDRNAHSFDYSVIALGDAYAEMRDTLVFEHGFNIGEVKIYECGIDDEFGNTLYALL